MKMETSKNVIPTKVGIQLIAALLLLSCQAKTCRAPASLSSSEEGKYLYEMHCASCHGLKGDGKGPVAQYLWPKPRDFTRGILKYRRGRGPIPSDLDLMQTMYLGIPGTSMPGWHLLSKKDWELLLAHLKTFSPRLTNMKPGPEVEIPDEPKSTPEGIRAGRELYERSGCVACHGGTGQGDGPGAYILKDVWGDLITPRDLTRGPLKWGNTSKDIYRTLMIGISGTPMPSYEHTFTPAQTWNLVHYIQSLQRPLPKDYDPSNPHHNLLEIAKVPGDIPLDYENEAWQKVKEIPVFLKPLWHEPRMTEWISLKALQNGKEVAFYLRWEDDQMDIEGKRKDAAAVQFPLDKIASPLQLPYLGMGSESKRVNIWEWKAGQFTDWNAAGIKTLSRQEEDRQNITGKGTYANGQWHVIFKRSLSPVGRGDAPLLDVGYLSFALWDADLPEHKGPASFSEWVRYSLR